MPLFGKSKYEKALEERDTLLRYIENEITRGTDQYVVSEYVREKLSGNETKDIFYLYGHEEEINICKMPEKYNSLTKYIFMRSLYGIVSILFHMEEKTGKDYYFCRYVNYEFINVIYENVEKSDLDKQYKNSEKYLEEALSVAKAKSGSPKTASEVLRNLGVCAWKQGRQDDGRSKIREAISSMEIVLKISTDNSKDKDEIRKHLEHFQQLLVKMGG